MLASPLVWTNWSMPLVYTNVWTALGWAGLSLNWSRPVPLSNRYLTEVSYTLSLVP